MRPRPTSPTRTDNPLMRRCSGPSERRDDLAGVEQARRRPPADEAEAPVAAPSLPGPPGSAGPTAGTRRSRRRPRGEAGFGLLEMIVAFTVLLVVLVATAELTSSILGDAATTHAQVTATDLADQVLNQLSQDSIQTLQTDVNRDLELTSAANGGSPYKIGGETYNVWQYLGWYGTGDAPSLCVTGNPPEVMQATVTVTWGESGRLAETSVINPPYGSAQSTDGWLSVRIESAADPNDPPSDVSAVAVSVTPQGGSPTSYTPDDQGCVYDAVAAGSYTVAVTGPGSPVFVNNNNLTTPPAVAASVTAGQATDVDVQYDEADTLSFSPAASSPPAATGMPITVANPGMTAGSQVAVPYGSATDGPVEVFPFSSGYSVWYGDCTDEEPAAPSAVAVSAGQSTTASVGGLEPLTLAVSVPGASVSGTATLTDPSCSTENYGLGTAQAVNGTATLSAQIIPESYTLTLTDLSDNQSTQLFLAWSSTNDEWLYSTTSGGPQTLSPPTSPIPVTGS